VLDRNLKYLELVKKSLRCLSCFLRLLSEKVRMGGGGGGVVVKIPRSKNAQAVKAFTQVLICGTRNWGVRGDSGIWLTKCTVVSQHYMHTSVHICTYACSL
jgi:hypothetical protein